MNILELSQTRFSARKYTDEAVSDDDLAYILECVRLAPSAVNRQPWKFVVVRSKEAKEQLWQAYDRDWFRTAPLYIVCMKNTASAGHAATTTSSTATSTWLSLPSICASLQRSATSALAGCATTTPTS